MSEHSRKILNLLAEGKITAADAERLLAAVDGPASAPVASAPSGGKAPKYLRVQVDKAERGEHRAKTVNIRVPLGLMRAGARLPVLLPAKAREAMSSAMAEKGFGFDFDKLKGDNLEAFIAALGDSPIDIDADDGRATIKVSCE